MPRHAEPITEVLDERECLRLVAPGGVGRIAFVGELDLTVLPVNYRLIDGTILFRTREDGLIAALAADVHPWAGGTWRLPTSASSRARC